MHHRRTTFALAGALVLGAAACADDADLERARAVEEATVDATTRPVLDPEDKTDLLEVISDVAAIAAVVPDLFDLNADTDIEEHAGFDLTCVGGLEPTVIFVGRASSTWPGVDHGELSADLFGSRVCTYDAQTPEPTTPEAIAAEAAAATEQIRSNGSVTVVGQADSPEAVDLFAEQYPDDVVGLTIIDDADGWADISWRDLYGQHTR